MGTACYDGLPPMELLSVQELQGRPEYFRHLEAGNILFFPTTPFSSPADEIEVLRGTAQAGGGHHQNIAYRPGPGKVTGLDKRSVQGFEKLRGALRGYSQRALDLLG